ncbi:MAG: ATP-dependent DNA helicase RecG [Ignavibacteria bacterium]|nr:ATP-dependent DNA helicase RecG [Ignavibacteria bacterium]
MTDNLSKSVQYLKSVGPKRAESFAQIGINTIEDLLYYFPTKYLDRTTILNTVKVYQLIRNGYDGEVTIIGEVVSKQFIRYGKKQLLKVKFKDKSGFFECIWFQGIKFFKDIFNTGEIYAISSKPVITKYEHLQFAHPDFDKLAEIESKEFINTGKIIPFYRLPKELRLTNIGDFSLRKIIHQAVDNFSDELNETLPEFLIKEKNLLDIKTTIQNLHFPQNHDLLHNAQHRMKYEELFYVECLVALRKTLVKNENRNHYYQTPSVFLKEFLNSLPYQLTKSQVNVLSEIRKDLESDKPMHRLLQGDVGSGKTIVALITMLIVVSSGYQSVFMVPTEILADQHFKNFAILLQKFSIHITLLIGGQKKSLKDQNLSDIKSGKAQIIIGTHALIEENVEYKNLGLIIIDEQHRFGVVQRSALISKGLCPDVLIMTATPIPRTLTMTLYGDLDLSIIDEMPANRKQIKTYIRGENKLLDVYKFIIDKSKENNQTFLIYPLVEDSDKLDLKAAETYYKELKNNYLNVLNVGLIHGKMNWQEKEQVMLDFANKKYHVLISTTVIEVGIDIPDANIIVINDAYRFGLSQLHQLRGRVGRGIKQAYCILITKDALAIKSNQFNYNFEYLSQEQIERNKSIIRLNAMLQFSNGFDLSEIDFKLRGPGDIFGTKQSGIPELKFASLIDDYKIVTDARDSAFKIISDDPFLREQKNSLIKTILKENYSNHIQLSKIG